MTRLALSMLCLCAFGQALAETRYVTDTFAITMRTGESTRHKIVRMLETGTPVEVLASSPDTGYAKVRTEDGTSGFVLERHLIAEPVARDRIVALEARLQELQQEPDQLTGRLAELQRVHAELEDRHRELLRDKSRLEEELATIRHASANVLQITRERSELRQSVAELTRQVAEVQQANQDLGNRTTQRWFLIGAGVVAGGILIGLILPNLRFRRRRSSWGSL